MDGVARVAADEFDDRVVRHMVTMLYTGHKPGAVTELVGVPGR